MAKIYSLKIENYRTFEHFECKFGDENLVILIGRGDSGKSTILSAINAVLSTTWNLQFCDTDFYKGDLSKNICIEANIIECPEELMNFNKFGFHYCLLKQDGTISNDVLNENERDRRILRIRLEVDSDLDPTWTVFSDRKDQEPKPISNKDRAVLNMFMVSDYIDNHFSISRRSPLSNLIRSKLDDKDLIKKDKITLSREANNTIKEKGNIEKYNDIIRENITKKDLSNLGVDIEKFDLETLLEFTESEISLHNNGIPLRLQGKGSKRLLSIAIQLALIEEGGIILIDEIEQGLEPDRIVNLIHVFKNKKHGQIFLTTHSLNTIVEANYNNLFMVKKGDQHLITFDDSFSRYLRTNPELFFCKKIIACEGKTEYGIIRAIDLHLSKEGNGLASKGIVAVNMGGGSKFYDISKKLYEIGYKACVFADNDVKDLKKNKDELKNKGIEIFTWDEKKSTEKQIFNDLPWDLVDLLGNSLFEKFEDDLKHSSKPIFSPQAEEDEKRDCYAKKANDDGWFKDISRAEFLGEFLIKHLSNICETKMLRKVIEGLMKWIKH